MTWLQYLITAVSVGGLYAIYALGIAIIYGVAGVVNFAHGHLMAVAAYVLLGFAGLPTLIAVPGAVLAGVAAALLTERGIFRFARGADAGTLLVLAFAIATMIEALILLTAGGESLSTSFGTVLTRPVSIGDLTIARIDLVTLAVAAVLLAGLAALLNRTTTGIQLRAAAEDFTMARLVGVRSDRVFMVAFALSGVLAGVAAVLLVVRSGTLSPTMGLGPVIIAFVAVVIGGLGSLSGAAIGGFVLGGMTVVLQVVLPDDARPYRDAMLYAVVIAVLTFRPQGLMPAKSSGTRV